MVSQETQAKERLTLGFGLLIGGPGITLMKKLNPDIQTCAKKICGHQNGGSNP